MLQTLLVSTEYCFRPGPGVTDWFEHHQGVVDKKLNGQAHVFDKKGGLIRVLILGEDTTVNKANILRKIEDVTGLVYSHNQEVQLMPEYGNTLKRMYGDNVIIK
jgi:hypothetical protein